MATLLLLIIYLTFISLGLPDSLLGAAWPVMRHDLGAPIGMAGVLSFTVTIGTIVSALATSRVVRRIGTARTTLISVAMTAGALLGFSIAPSIAWLMVFAIPLGLGGGAVDSALNHYIAGHYEARRHELAALFLGRRRYGQPDDSIRLPVRRRLERRIRDDRLHPVGDRGGAYCVAAPVETYGEEAGRRRTGPAGGCARARAGRRTQAEKCGRRQVRAGNVPVLLRRGGDGRLVGHSYLVNVKGISADDAALSISIYFMGITIGRFVNGFVTLKFSSLTLIRAGQITTLAGALLLLLPLPAGFSLAGFLITGLGLAPIFPSMLHETPVRFGEAHAGRIMGYQFATAYTGAALLPPLLGMLAGYWTIGISRCTSS